MSAAASSTIPDPQRGNAMEWLPVLLWGVVIFILSTANFSAYYTSRMIEPILRFLFPFASAAAIAMMHMLIRKAAHFTEYGVLFWLLARGPLRGRAAVALAICVIYALLDEGHQMFVPGRTASLYDVALDSTGALFSNFLHSAVSEFG